MRHELDTTQVITAAESLKAKILASCNLTDIQKQILDNLVEDVYAWSEVHWVVYDTLTERHEANARYRIMREAEKRFNQFFNIEEKW